MWEEQRVTVDEGISIKNIQPFRFLSYDCCIQTRLQMTHNEDDLYDMDFKSHRQV